MLPTVPRFLRVAGWVAAMTVVANPVADTLGLKYRQSLEQIARVDDYLQRGVPADVLDVQHGVGRVRHLR